MGKSTRPVFWGCAVITGHILVPEAWSYGRVGRGKRFSGHQTCPARLRGVGGGGGALALVLGLGIAPTIELYVDRFYKEKFN